MEYSISYSFKKYESSSSMKLDSLVFQWVPKQSKANLTR
jgi:hypothetical protein